MDRRFLIALLLTAVVVALTPVLFPSPKRVPAGSAVDSLGRDSLGRATGVATGAPAGATAGAAAGATTSVAAAASAPAASAPAVVDSGRRTATIGALPATDTVGAAGTAGAPPAPETTTIETPRVRYRFSSVGAAPLSAELKDYRSYAPRERNMTLESPGEALLKFRLVSAGDTVRLDRTPFAVQRAANGDLTYEAVAGALRARIAYSFAPDSYLVRVSGKLEGAPPNAYLFIEMPRTLRSQERDTTADIRSLAFAYKPQGQSPSSVAFASLDPGESFSTTEEVRSGLTWIAAKNKYFLVALLAKDETSTPFVELGVTGGQRVGKEPTIAIGTVVAKPSPDGTFAFELFTGPQDAERLQALGREFENVNPYGGFMQGLVQPFATIVIKILLWMHRALNLSYGWVLVLFGVAVRVVLWPLNQSSMRTSMKMQRVQPELSAIQKRYASDPEKLQAEMMKVYKAHGMTPFSGLAGCLPALLPMPVLITLFFVFQNTIEFRGVPFLWLQDISVHDPYYIIPIVMGASAYLLSWIGLRNMPPNPQATMMSYMFPAMMLIFFIKAAAGLNLYYAVQNIAALPQQWLIARERSKQGPTPTPAPPTPPPARPAGGKRESKSRQA